MKMTKANKLGGRRPLNCVPELPASEPNIAADEDRPDGGVRGQRCGDVDAVGTGKDLGQVGEV